MLYIFILQSSFITSSRPVQSVVGHEEFQLLEAVLIFTTRTFYIPSSYLLCYLGWQSSPWKLDTSFPVQIRVLAPRDSFFKNCYNTVFWRGTGWSDNPLWLDTFTYLQEWITDLQNVNFLHKRDFMFKITHQKVCNF